MNDDIPFACANADSMNTGVFDEDGNRLPTKFTAHVDDNIFAEVAQYLKRSVAASIVSVDEAFGGSHEYQEDVLSDEKLHLLYKETRLLLGHLPNSRSMTVEISPRRREKTIQFILEEGWLDSRTSASIRDIARLLGLMQSICNIFLWGQAQILVLQQLLATAVQRGYQLARQNYRLDKKIRDERAQVPAGLAF